MSRRTQPIVEEFDDDTDLPLPSRPLPNTGDRGALLQSVDSDDEDAFEPGFGADLGGGWPHQRPGPASPSNFGMGGMGAGMGMGAGLGMGSPFGVAQQQPGAPLVTDLTPYKKWTCVYPIYLDAKRPFATGSRRVARLKAVWWPLSKDIADAALRLGLGTLHEMQKCHPQDWENPGRVRVQWKKDGRLVNERIRTKKQLLEEISAYIQRVKPELVPKPPGTSTGNVRTPASNAAATNNASKVNTKSKSSTKPASKPSKPTKPTSTSSNAKSKLTAGTQPQPHRKSAPRTPRPPRPQPPLASRVSAYSPALPSGMLVETLKAGMNAAAEGSAAGGPMAGMGGKGKRKVVRVRG